MFLNLGKLELNGTRAWIFAIMNMVKIPVQMHRGLITVEALQMLIPAFIVAVCTTFFTEHFITSRINQKVFEELSWVLVIVGAYKLTFPNH